MTWQILALISVVSYSTSALYQKMAMRKESSDPIISSIIFQFLLGFITLAFALSRGFTLPPVSLLPAFFVSGALYAIGTIAFFRAMKAIEASLVTVLAAAGVIVTIIASFIFLGDTLGFSQILGVVLILCAVIIINYTKQTFRLNTGSLQALLGAGSYGFAVVIDSYIISRFNAVSFLPIVCFIPGLLILVSFWKKYPLLISAVKTIDTNLVTYIFLYSVQAITFYLALEQGALVSQMSIIAKSSIILTVLMSAVFLKERNKLLNKSIATILTTIGVLLVS